MKDVYVQRYKREAYRGSEFAARILSENGLSVVVKVGNCPIVPPCRIVTINNAVRSSGAQF
jgi:hypothetical protein